jgi:valyl-tRNA synthetase
MLLRMLHPFMPFLTEELWHKLPGERTFLAAGTWPDHDPSRIDDSADRQMGLVQSLVVKIRNLRAETNIDTGQRVDVLLHASTEQEARLLREQSPLIASLCRAGRVKVEDHISEDVVAARGVAGGVQIAIPLEGLFDFDAARERILKDLGKLDKELVTRSKKLSNASFLERAPADVVEKERRLHGELLERKAKLESNLALLGDGGSS